MADPYINYATAAHHVNNNAYYHGTGNSSNNQVPQTQPPPQHGNPMISAQQQQQYVQQQYLQQQQQPQQQPVYLFIPNQQQQQQQAYQHGQKTMSQASPSPSPSSSGETSNLYMALVGMSDAFLAKKQPRLAIHCLESIIAVKSQDISIATSLHVQLRTRLNLCRLYLDYTINTNQYVNAHIEKSMLIIQNLNPNDELKYEATLTLYELFQRQRELQAKLKSDATASSNPAQQIDPNQLNSLYNLDLIRKVLETSKAFPIWHLRLLFSIGNIAMREKDYNSACYFMSVGANYCSQNPQQLAYAHILFILSKGLIHLVQKNTNELQTTMQPCASLIENYKTPNGYQTELLKIFFLVLQVTYFIQCGQAKSVRNTLKSLQHYVTSLSARFDSPESSISEASAVVGVGGGNPLESFHWLHKDHLGILAYLLTVIHTVQTGSYDKAQRLVEKTLVSVERLRSREAAALTASEPPSLARFMLTSTRFITNRLHIMLIENQARCSVALGHRALAIKQIADAFKLCEIDSRLFGLHTAQLHCMLGIYSQSTNHKEAAVSQLNQALKCTDDTDLWLYCAMSLALCYVPHAASSNSSKTQLLSIIDNVLPDKIQTQSTSLIAFAHYFKALKFFFGGNLQLAQESLREAILLANSEDLMTISANAMLFSGHVNLISGQYQESFNMLTNGFDLADKTNDVALKSYATLLLKDLYNNFNDQRVTDVIKINTDLEQRATVDFQEAIKQPQHALINWNGNSLPSIVSGPNSNQQQHQAQQQQQPQQQTTPSKPHRSEKAVESPSIGHQTTSQHHQQQSPSVPPQQHQNSPHQSHTPHQNKQPQPQQQMQTHHVHHQPQPVAATNMSSPHHVSTTHPQSQQAPPPQQPPPQQHHHSPAPQHRHHHHHQHHTPPQQSQPPPTVAAQAHIHSPHQVVAPSPSSNPNPAVYHHPHQHQQHNPHTTAQVVQQHIHSHAPPQPQQHHHAHQHPHQAQPIYPGNQPQPAAANPYQAQLVNQRPAYPANMQQYAQQYGQSAAAAYQMQQQFQQQQQQQYIAAANLIPMHYQQQQQQQQQPHRGSGHQHKQ